MVSSKNAVRSRARTRLRHEDPLSVVSEKGLDGLGEIRGNAVLVQGLPEVAEGVNEGVVVDGLEVDGSPS